MRIDDIVPGMSLHTLPPIYSEADKERREAALKAIAALEREYRERCQPFIDELASIESRYVPRYVFMPDTPAPALPA